MAQQNLDFGTAVPNDGEFLETAFVKVQGNFTELYAGVDAANTAITAVGGALTGHITAATGAHAASAIAVTPTGSLSAVNVQAALAEIDGDVTLVTAAIGTVASDLAGHIADPTAAHAASAISMAPTGSLSSTTVQAGLAELDGDVTAHLNDTVDAHDASAISFVPAGSLSSITAQAALAEVDGDVTAHLADATDAHDASAISYSNTTSGLAAPNIQSAVDELAWQRPIPAAIYNVEGDGTTDDTSAINNWMAAVAASPYKAGLWVGRSGQTFKVTSTLRWDSYSNFFTMGRNTTILATYNGPIFQSVGGTTARRYGLVIIGGLTIDCTSRVTYPNSIAMDLRNASHCIIPNLWMKNAGTGLQNFGDTGVGAYYNTMFHLSAESCDIGYENAFEGNSAAYYHCKSDGCTIAFRENSTGTSCKDFVAENFTTAVSVLGSADHFALDAQRLENAPTSGTGILIAAGANKTQITNRKFVGLTTNISDLGTRTKVDGAEQFSATINPASLAAHTANDNLVSRASMGSSDRTHVMADPSVVAGIMATPIGAAGGVYVRVVNFSTGVIDPASQTYRLITWASLNNW